MDDKVVIENAPDWVEKYRLKLEQAVEQGKRKYGAPLKGRRARKIVEKAQQAADSAAEESRKNAVKMDDILRIQRELIYDFRDYIMKSTDLTTMVQQIKNDYFNAIARENKKDAGKLLDFIINNVDYNYMDNDFNPEILESTADIKQYLEEIARNRWSQQQMIVNNKFKQNYLERLAVLKALDVAWIEQVDNLQQLKTVVTSRSSGQHNPVFEYEKEAMHSFEQMKKLFWKNTVKYMLLSELIPGKNGSVRVEFP